MNRAGEPEPVVAGCFWLLADVAGAGAARKKIPGAGAANKLAGFKALLEDKKHKEIVLLLLFFWENSKFVWLNKQLFYLFYIFCSFTLLVCGENNILPNLTNSQEPEPLKKNTRSWSWSRSQSRLEKNQEPELLEKKSGARAAKKLAGSPALQIGLGKTFKIDGTIYTPDYYLHC